MNDEQIRKRVETRVKAKMGFYHSLVTYLIVNAILALINILTPHQNLWFLWVAVLWGVVIVFRFFRVFVFPEHRVEEMEERMVEREMKRERERQQVKGGDGAPDEDAPTT